MGSDVDGEILGSEFKGYTLRITGGNDKQGFTMKQGILVGGRVRILMRGSKYHPFMRRRALLFFLIKLYLIVFN